LNQKKQLGKLRQDSLLNDFTITVSPTEQLVSILCSTGFYTLVAVPVFSRSSVGSTHHVAGITMHCYDVTGGIDDVGANVNAVIFYRFTNSSDKTSAGGVTVHLHHTARRVQVQGSTMVTSQCRSSVWFVEKYLLGRFTEESQKKSFDISRFNAAVNSLVSKHVDKINAMEKCEACNGHFNGRSIREQCRRCSKTFHKKCIQHTGHTCMRSTAMPTLPTHGMEPPTRPQPGLGLAPLVRPELVEQPRPDNNPLIRPGNITEKHSSVYRAGMTGSALLLVNNRLENRSTVYQWDDEMLGPARDKTGFEQGGINSEDFYKLYNNTQLKSAQSSSVGVDIGSSVVSAIGQADDVILAANTVDSLRLLAMLTESYCARYRVTLVPSKTKLLPMYHPRHTHLVDYAKLTNPVTIDDTSVKFVDEAEHVGVLRSTAVNMPHILQRITSHKNDLGTVCSAGMARGQRRNPAASLRVHQLHASSFLRSGNIGDEQS
jgi:hypothetical protein